MLHFYLVLVAPGCLVAGWWQATRALHGNALSWVYSIEWPAFAVIAVLGWWHLVHEDPEAYRARKARSREVLPPVNAVVYGTPEHSSVGVEPAPPDTAAQ